MTGNDPAILIAPACYKGSLPAVESAGIIERVLRHHLPSYVQLDACPVADGGDDTLSVLEAADTGFERHSCVVMGPLPDQRVTAQYLVHPARKLAVLEAAQAHGYCRLPEGTLAPLESTSYGVGELMKSAIKAHPFLDAVVITLGGSASTDGGLGALQALGVRFLDEQGRLITQPLSGATLTRIKKAERPEPWHFAGRVLIATDVINPLLGPDGAAHVFGPQKGATSRQCQELDQALMQVSQLMTRAFDLDYSALPGAGAAGGLAYGLRHLPRSGIVSGSQWVAEFLQLEARIQPSDLIITGEGRLDATSLAGKATGHLLIWAGLRPVFLFPGQVQEGLTFPPNVFVHPLMDGTIDEKTAMRQAAERLARRVEAAVPSIRAQLGL